MEWRSTTHSPTPSSGLKGASVFLKMKFGNVPSRLYDIFVSLREYPYAVESEVDLLKHRSSSLTSRLMCGKASYSVDAGTLNSFSRGGADTAVLMDAKTGGLWFQDRQHARSPLES